MTLTTTDQKRSVSCHFCNSCEHKIYDCGKFKNLNVDARWNFVSKQSLCISCLGKYHNSKNCKLRRNCGIDKCHLPHNKMLHKMPNNSIPDKDKPAPTDTNCNVNTFFDTVLLKVYRLGSRVLNDQLIRMPY